MSLVIETTWSEAPGKLRLDRGEVHVWKVDLDRAPEKTAPLSGLLSAQERGQARRFRQVRDRTGYLVSHAALRILLGGYLALPPEEIAFAVSAGGKPHLPPFPGGNPISFNLSHSGRFALIGMASGQELGIDIECVDPDFPMADVALRVLTKAELLALASLPDQLRIPAFYRFWTMKEACLKGGGSGVAREMNSLELFAPPGRRACRCRAAGGARGAKGWLLLEPPSIPGYASALAVATEPSRVRFCRFRSEYV